MTQFTLFTLVLTRFYALSTRFFYNWIMYVFSYYNKDTQRNQNKVIIGGNIVFCFSCLSVL